jgi:Uncharacterized protein conserved in bacteria
MIEQTRRARTELARTEEKMNAMGSFMKKAIAVCAIAAVCAGAVSAADKTEGYWKSIDDKTGKTTAVWRIYQKDAVLYGEIALVPGQDDATLAWKCKASYKGFPIAGDVNKMTVVNTPFIFGLTMKGDGRWQGGNIIDAGDGSLYQCKITFRAADGKKCKSDVLEMRGEIGLCIGKSQFWERTTEEEITSLR